MEVFHTCRKPFGMQDLVFSAWKRNTKTLVCFCAHREVILPLIYHLGCAPRARTRRALLSRSRCSAVGCIRWRIEGTVCLIMTSCCPAPSGLLRSHQRSDEDPQRSERETCLFSFDRVIRRNQHHLYLHRLKGFFFSSSKTVESLTIREISSCVYISP